MRFTVYNPTTGEILRTGQCPEGAADLQAGAGESVLYEASDPFSQYVSGGALTAKQNLSASWDKTQVTADGVDTATLSGLPDPITFHIDGDSYEVVGGTLSFKASTPGEYRIEAVHPEYLYAAWEIEGV
jgi:hypothetical protein